MNDLKKVDALLRRYQEGNCTSQEEEWIENILFENPADALDVSKDQIYKEKLWLKLDKLTKPVQRKNNIRYYYAAAAIALCISISAYFMLHKQVFVEESSIQKASIIHDITPGGNRATLTLADGRKVELDSHKDGIIINENGINYSDESNLDINTNTGDDAFQIMQISTPRGGQYQVTLPDGTNVWMNADSKLKYPNQFAEDKRVVYLEGEAYFEVNEQLLKNTSHNLSLPQKKPFIVTTNGQDVKVLGTKFNINTHDDKFTKTTLASGHVQVITNRNNVIDLFPNQQAINKNGNLNKIKVDVSQVLAWRYGKFSFDNKPFDVIMNELARWYDIEVIYNNEIPKIELIGDAYRDQNISLILRILDISKVNYKMDNNKRKLLIY